jgi:hypothetical protein
MAQIVNNQNGGTVDGGGAKPLQDNTWLTNMQCITTPCGGQVGLNWKPNPEVTDSKGQAISQAQKDLLEIETNKQFLLSTNKSEPLTAEDKFYESLGIKKSSGGWGIQSRPMGRILVAVVLVAGYFAYKKFKK